MKNIRMFTSRDSLSIAVPADRVLCNDVIFEHEGNPNHVALWVASTAHGPMGAVWAHDAEEALNELVDQDLAGAILVDPSSISPEDEEHLTRLGNYGSPCNLDDTFVEKVMFIPDRDYRVMLKFAEARGAGHDNLDF